MLLGANKKARAANPSKQRQVLILVSQKLFQLPAERNDVANRVHDAKLGTAVVTRDQRQRRLIVHSQLAHQPHDRDQRATHAKADEVAETEAGSKAPHALRARETGACGRERVG